MSSHAVLVFLLLISILIYIKINKYGRSLDNRKGEDSGKGGIAGR